MTLYHKKLIESHLPLILGKDRRIATMSGGLR